MDTNRWDLNIFCVTLPFSGWLCFTDPKDGKLAKKMKCRQWPGTILRWTTSFPAYGLFENKSTVLSFLVGKLVQKLGLRHQTVGSKYSIGLGLHLLKV